MLGPGHVRAALVPSPEVRRHVPPLGAGVSSDGGREHVLDQWLTVCGRGGFSLFLPRV